MAVIVCFFTGQPSNHDRMGQRIRGRKADLRTEGAFFRNVGIADVRMSGNGLPFLPIMIRGKRQ